MAFMVSAVYSADMAHTHLSQDERDIIAVLRGEGRTLRSIAEQIKRDPSTLSREFKRNAPPHSYGLLSSSQSARASSGAKSGKPQEGTS